MHLRSGVTWRLSRHHPPSPAEKAQELKVRFQKKKHENLINKQYYMNQTSSGVCSARRRRPSNRKAMELNSTDCRSQ